MSFRIQNIARVRQIKQSSLDWRYRPFPKHFDTPIPPETSECVTNPLYQQI